MSVRTGFSGNVIGSYLTSGSKKVSHGILHVVDNHGHRETPVTTGLSLLVDNRVGVAAAGRQVACKPHER